MPPSKMEVTLNFTLSETESFFINALMIKNTLIENSIDIVQAAYRVSEIKTWFKEVSAFLKKWVSQTEPAVGRMLAITNV